MNKENDRKEFFKVTVEEVRTAMERMGVESDWYFDAEAREHNESIAMRKALERENSRDRTEMFPEAI